MKRSYMETYNCLTGKKIELENELKEIAELKSLLIVPIRELDLPDDIVELLLKRGLTKIHELKKFIKTKGRFSLLENITVGMSIKIKNALIYYDEKHRDIKDINFSYIENLEYCEIDILDSIKNVNEKLERLNVNLIETRMFSGSIVKLLHKSGLLTILDLLEYYTLNNSSFLKVKGIDDFLNKQIVNSIE